MRLVGFLLAEFFKNSGRFLRVLIVVIVMYTWVFGTEIQGPWV